MRSIIAALFALSVAGCGSTSGSGSHGLSSSLECVPYARQVSGVQLYGHAADWWDNADGRYAKGSDPVPGGVLVLRRTGRLPYGHVAVVRSQQSAREITVDQANWVHHRITTGERVIDVSPGNDWSAVRVWWDPSNSMGATTYPAFGFIAP
jgi:surface antigen